MSTFLYLLFSKLFTIFAVTAENFTREKIGNAKASSRTTLGSAVILSKAKNLGKFGNEKIDTTINYCKIAT